MASSKTNPVKKHFSFTIKDFHKEYKSYLKDQGINECIDYKTYKKIMTLFFKKRFQKVIYDQHVFMMPYGLGTVYVKAVKCDPKNLAIDFKKTKELGKTVRYLNLHTNGYYYMIAWEKDYVRFKNKSFYTFKPISSQYATEQGIGKVALGRHIRDTAHDPTKKLYSRI